MSSEATESEAREKGREARVRHLKLWGGVTALRSKSKVRSSRLRRKKA